MPPANTGISARKADNPATNFYSRVSEGGWKCSLQELWHFQTSCEPELGLYC